MPSWDPNQRFTPDAQPIFKAVFDQPLDQDPQLKLIPHLIKSWNLAPDALSMAVELRDDVTFHNGDKMTTEDFRYTFFERIKSGVKLDIANSMRKVQDIVIELPTKATMKFDSPAPTMPQWMAFLGSYIVPKKYIESQGLDNFLKKPDRHRALQARRIRAELPHRAGALRQLLGTEGEDRACHHPDHQGSFGAGGGDPVGTGRLHHQCPGSRGATLRTGGRLSPPRSIRSRG